MRPKQPGLRTRKPVPTKRPEQPVRPEQPKRLPTERPEQPMRPEQIGISSETHRYEAAAAAREAAMIL